MVNIASQNFNSLSDNATAVDDTFSVGSITAALTNGGSFNFSNLFGLGFQAFWTDTRGNEGPNDPASESSGDFIGVNSFSGGNSPNVAADGTAVASGLEHNFEFNDADGRLDLVFDPVDVSGFSDRNLTFNYWINDTGYESDDSFSFSLSDGTNTQSFLNFGEAELEANASADNGTANWQTASVDIDALVDDGFGENLTLTISVDNNSGAENIFVDNIAFTAGEDEEEPVDQPINKIGSITLDGGAEINAFDPSTNQLFVVSGGDLLQIVDLSNPTNPVALDPIDLSSLEIDGFELGGANSVAVSNGLVAVALEADDGTATGRVVFFDSTDGSLLNTFEVGVLPDMLTFTPDGNKVLVANEAEPDGNEDPEASVSIIDHFGWFG